MMKGDAADNSLRPSGGDDNNQLAITESPTTTGNRHKRSRTETEDIEFLRVPNNILNSDSATSLNSDSAATIIEQSEGRNPNGRSTLSKSITHKDEVAERIAVIRLERQSRQV